MEHEVTARDIQDGLKENQVVPTLQSKITRLACMKISVLDVLISVATGFMTRPIMSNDRIPI